MSKSSVNITESSPLSKDQKIYVKSPKKVLHFSDGITDDDTSDEEAEFKQVKDEDQKKCIDPKTLNWMPWLSYCAIQGAKNVLSTCDYIGEGLANAFGITSQKYFYEIEEYKRTMQEEADDAVEVEVWSEGPKNDSVITKNFEKAGSSKDNGKF